MDFVSDGLVDGRRLRYLNIVDDFTKECLAIEVDTSLPGYRVVEVLERLMEMRGLPESVTVDDGPEFADKVLDEWADRKQLRLQFITPGKPQENAYIESFNDKFRDECLNEHWFISIRHARARNRGMARGVQQHPGAQHAGLLGAAGVCKEIFNHRL